MIEYDDPHRAAYRGHFAGIEGSNLASPLEGDGLELPVREHRAMAASHGFAAASLMMTGSPDRIVEFEGAGLERARVLTLAFGSSAAAVELVCAATG